MPTAIQREEDLVKGFREGEKIWKAAVAARQKVAASFKGFWEGLAQDLRWRFAPLERRANLAEKRGATFTADNDPRKFLDDLGYKDTTVMRWGRQMFEKVIQPVEAAGMTLEDMGKYLFYTRVMNDRSGLANPGGFTPAAARLGLLKMNLDLGLGKLTILRSAVQTFHDAVFTLSQQAMECGGVQQADVPKRDRAQQGQLRHLCRDGLPDRLPVPGHPAADWHVQGHRQHVPRHHSQEHRADQPDRAPAGQEQDR